MTFSLLDDTLMQVTEERLGALLQAKHRGDLTPTGQAEIVIALRTLAGRTGPARLILMAGLPGSGKTTVARDLETRGFLRICPDERVWQQHGHYGRDFPEALTRSGNVPSSAR